MTRPRPRLSIRIAHYMKDCRAIVHESALLIFCIAELVGLVVWLVSHITHGK